MKKELSLLNALRLENNFVENSTTVSKLVTQKKFENARELLIKEISKFDLNVNSEDEIEISGKNNSASINVISSHGMNEMKIQRPMPLWSEILKDNPSTQIGSPAKTMVQLKPPTSGKRLAQRELKVSTYNKSDELSWRCVSDLFLNRFSIKLLF